MSQFFAIHPETPQARLIQQAVDIIQRGGVVVYPTDSAYALGCQLGDKKAMERIRRIRALRDDHNFTLVCRDLSELGTYARVDNTAYRLLRHATPVPTHSYWRRPGMCRNGWCSLNARRLASGCRTSDSPGALQALDEPLMSATLALPGMNIP